MKNKILTILLSISLAFTITLACFNVYAIESLQVGDTNGDGAINIKDLTHLAQYLAGWDVELGKSSSTDSEEVITTILKSDFEKDLSASSWNNGGTTENMTDSTGDYLRLTGQSNGDSFVRSPAFLLTPGKKYKLTYSIRVPSVAEGNKDYSTPVSNILFNPEALIYQTPGATVGENVTTPLLDPNLYAHVAYERRVGQNFVWTVEGYNAVTRTGYSDTGYTKHSAIYQSVKNVDGTYPSLNEVFSEWKTINLEFIATGETEDDTTPTFAVLNFRMLGGAKDYMFDLKDVHLVDTNDDADPISFDNNNEDNIYQHAPEGEVHVLMFRKWHASEQKLIDDYQLKTGVKIKTTITTESDYNTKLVSMVSGGNSPDIVLYTTTSFPGLVTKALQPLQNKYFRLDSDCWNKAYMDAYRINGVYFGVAQPQSWSCEDCTYVTYYSPQILKNCGITTTPYQLYMQGKWNWAKQKEIALAVKNKGFVGLSVQSYDLFMLSAGKDFASYDGSQYTNNLGSVTVNDLLSQAWMEAADLKAQDVLTGWDLNNVQQGKVGLFSAISYGLRSEGNWFQKSFAETLEAVPLAGPTADAAYTPVRPKVWGVPKKAKNPEGAAYFLRYFLDVSNYDHNSTFFTQQQKEVYNIITSPNAKKTIMHGWGVADYVESGTYSSICNTLIATASQNITSQLNSKKGYVETGIARANKDLERIKQTS